MSRRGWLLFGAMCLIWGLPYLLIRVAVRELSPASLVFARTALAAVVLVPLALRRSMWAEFRRSMGWIAIFAIIEMGIPWLLMSRAEQHLTSSVTGLMVAAVPLVAVVAYRWSGAHEPLTARRVVGLVLGTIGVAILVGVDLTGTTVLPVLEMLVVVVGYAVGPLLLATKLVERPGLAVNAGAIGLVALLYAPVGIAQFPHHLHAETIWAVIVLGLVCTALAFMTFFELIKEIGPARSTVVTYVNPAVAVLLGVALLGEPITAGIVVGFPLILAGSILASTRSATELRAELPAER